MPQWKLADLNYIGDINYALPSFLNMAGFQRILLVYILEKTRLGQTQEVLKTLEASWQLNQTLLQRFELISGLVAIIVAKEQAIVMRKLPELPAEWQDRIERFSKYNLPQALLTG